MRLIPRDARGAIGFYNAHAGVWADNASALGLSSGEIAEFESDLAAAAEALSQQYAAQQQAQAATDRLHLAMEKLKGTGAGLVQRIRTKARMESDAEGEGASVYTLAHLPVPVKPSPIAPPGKPGSFAVDLSQVGWLTLTWKCKNPAGAVGTIYLIHRRVGAAGGPGTGAFEFISTVGERKFVDKTLPKGAAEVTYRVTAMRSTSRGPVAEYSIEIGTGRTAASEAMELQASGRVAA